MNEFDLFDPALQQEASDHLAFTLKLTIKGKEYKIAGANVKDCQLDCQLQGFEGSLAFSILNDKGREDKLIKAFAKEDLIEIELGIMPVFNLPKPPPKPFSIKGIITHKALRETIYEELKKPSVLYRHYHIRFADPAQALWQQHYPCELYVKQSMEELFKAQLTSQITLKMNLPSLKTKHPMICLGLGVADTFNNGTQHHYNQASFYDFTLNYLATQRAYFHYDYLKHSYLISADRPKPAKDTPFLPKEVHRITTFWPESKRYQAQILNAVVKNAQKETLSHKLAIEGIRHDHLLREPTASKLTKYKTAVKATLKNHGENLMIELRQWPTQTFAPASLFSTHKKVWSKDPVYVNNKYRAYRIQIHVSTVSDKIEHDIQDKSTAYRLSYHVQAELSTSDNPRLPNSLPVAYPIHVEGKIVSTIGDKKTDKTYDLAKNKETKQPQYKVNIPLWDKNILINALPDMINPHFYFPHYRDTKLLIHLDLYEARIARVLGWGDRVALPLDTQGNHLLFGKNKDNETSMKHVYDGENPALIIKRQKEKDNEQVKFEEGKLTLETNWEDK